MSQSSRLESLNRDGFVLIPSILTPVELIALRTASTETVHLSRSGRWPHVRTLPKQFPPWITLSGHNPVAKGIWGVQFLMHPSLPCSPIFVQHYFSNTIINSVKELLQCVDDDLVMELFNLLCRPEEDFELCWHRDDIPATATADEELERLKEPAWHTQWNLALFDDESLIVIPSSHLRARTDVERNARPYDHLSGEIRIKMKAGDMVFYDNNILHRGVYNAKVERMTLHGSMGHVGGRKLRARNVLQHGVRDWVGKVDLRHLNDQERERAGAMKRRLLKMGEESGEVGYSLKG